jgi:hypothetical protein
MPAGPTNPVTFITSKPLTPASAKVGTSGMGPKRLLAVTPRARMRPALIWFTEVLAWSK